MKKNILILVCLFYSMINYASVTHIDKVTPEPKPIPIRINFDIAKPANNCEHGLGICKVGVGLGRSGGDGRGVSAEAYIENGIFVMSIMKDYVSHEMQSELSALSYFNTDDDINVPEIWIEKMGLRDSYYIPEGKYRIMEYENRYEINFDLK
jgi:hypothetical protein